MQDNPSAEPSAPFHGGSTGPPAIPAERPREKKVVEEHFEFDLQPMEAGLTVRASVELRKEPWNASYLADKLRELGVVAGIKEAALAEIAEHRPTNRRMIVAAGRPPIPGRNASIELCFQSDGAAGPVELEDGSVDFKNIHSIPLVVGGDVVARKHAPTMGEPGLDIFGRKIPATPGRDANFHAGANTEISPDGLSLVAVKGGHVFLRQKAVCVEERYRLDGDVNYHTGNISYGGDVLIDGDVSDGFKVEAGGSISISGNVDGAELVSRSGSIVVNGGIFGADKARIYAKGDIQVSMAQAAEFHCEGSFEFTKSLLNCSVTARKIKACSASATAIGGNLTAYESIVLGNVGSTGNHTELAVFDERIEAARRRLEELRSKQDKARQACETLEKQLKPKLAMAKKNPEVLNEKIKAELARLGETLQKAEKLLRHFEAEELRLKEELAQAWEPKGELAIQGKVVWGVHLNMYHHHKDLEEGDSRARITWAPEGGFNSAPL